MAPTLLLLLLQAVLLATAQVAQAQGGSTLPGTIYYSATVRDFMAQACRILPVTDSVDQNRRDRVFEKNCPDNETIRQLVLAGTLSGHPDFQRSFSESHRDIMVDPDYRDSLTARYSSQLGTDFPITSENDGQSRPAVTTRMVYGTTGIPKMEYCTLAREAEEGYLCDVSDSKRSVYSQESFSTWYEDSRKYNRRMGYQQKLGRKTGSTYEYNSQSDSNFYDPIRNSGQVAKGWPQSPTEVLSQGVTNKKFWFTVEIHTSFEYTGGEEFTFKGDDDVHVYINERLVMNLGGTHEAFGATIKLNEHATKLGLVRGNIYQFDMFHAERQTTASNFLLTTTLAATCNVITSDFRTNGADVEQPIDWTATGATTNADWLVIAGPGFGQFASPASAKTMVLMSPGVPDVASYMFYKPNQVNVGSGFRFKFDFSMQGAAGHGFSVLFHNREQGMVNFNGGTGPNLGIKNTDNSFAIVFDMTNPAQQQLRVHYNAQGNRRNNVSNATRTVYDGDVIQDWTDGTWHSVEVIYYWKPDWLEVYVDDSLRLREKDFSMIDALGGRNAYIGFSTASSTERQQMTTQLRNVFIKTVKVLPRNSLSNVTLEDNDGNNSTGSVTLLADGRANASFAFSTRDACLNTVQYGGLSSMVQARMVGTVLSTDSPTLAPSPMPGNNSTERRRQLQQASTINVTIPATINDLNNGMYQANFSTTQVGSFSVHIGFGPGCTWNGTHYAASDQCWQLYYPDSVVSVPFVTFAPTTPEPEEAQTEVDTSSIVAVGVSVGIVSCCGLILIFLGVRIRNRWRKDRAFIEKGRLAVLERGIELEGDNDLDVLQTKLQQTLHEVQAERAKNYDGQDEAIQRLLQQRGELQEMVRRLKCKRDGIDPDIPPPPSMDDGFLARARKSVARRSLAPGAAGRQYGRSVFKSVAEEDLRAGGGGGDVGFLARMRQSVRRPFGGGGGQADGLAPPPPAGFDEGPSSSNPLFNSLKKQTLGRPQSRTPGVPE